VTTYVQQQRYWASIGYQPPTGRDRCAACGWHVPTQSHAEGCPEEEKS
jgi:hypothetical protein